MADFQTGGLIFLIIAAYALGSLPFGVIFTRFFTSYDITTEGSKNIGATNVHRIAGPVLGLSTLAGDMAKGAIPALFALWLLDTKTKSGEAGLSLVVAAAFLGHLYPLYFGFRKGGKGVATAAGSLLAVSFPAFLSCLGVFGLMVFFTRRVSAGSLSAAAGLPVFAWIFTDMTVFAIFCFCICVMIFIRHRENIKRLLNNTEPGIGSK